MRWHQEQIRDHRWRALTVSVAWLVAVLGGCNETRVAVPSRAPRPPMPAEAARGFVDVTDAAAVDFVHSFGDVEFSNLVESVGSGAAWLDYDQDGHLDLYLATGKHHSSVSKGDAPPGQWLNRLFRNRGDGTFEDVTAKAGVGCPRCYSMGVSAGDYDNDGYPDIYVCNFGPNVLLRNRGDGTFEDVGAAAGVADPGCSVAAAWLDFDRDGYIDLFVGNYIRFDPKYNLYYAPDGFPGPMAYDSEADRLYRNRGDGTFEDVSERMGIVEKGRAMAVAAADLNDDGFDEVFVANDAMKNFLYWNEGGKGFREGALMAGVAYNSAGDSASHMAIDFGDYDRDGRLDIFVSDSSISSLFHNDGGDMLRDVSIAAGVGRASAQFVGWGSFFFDFDNDGDLDIFKVNADLSRLFGQEAQLFENVDGQSFRDVSLEFGEFFRQEWMARGTACGDFDNDGDLDIVVVNLNSPAVLLRNDGNRNSWLEIVLRGRAGRLPARGGKLANRDGLGAKVLVTAEGRTQVAERRAGASYLSQNDPRLHFGLGAAENAERIEVRWPSGRTQVLTDVPARQILVVEEPDD